MTNHRAAGSDKSEALTPALRFSLERAIEYIAPDELVEVTPKSIRLRKRILDFNAKEKAKKTLPDRADLEPGSFVALGLPHEISSA